MRFILERESRNYPVIAENYIADEDGDERLIFTREEAEELRDQLTDILEALSPSYVRIKFDLSGNSAAMSYTYEDPSGELKVGDLVYAPTQYDDRPTLGKVVSLGRGTYTGRTKTVGSKLVPQDL